MHKNNRFSLSRRKFVSQTLLAMAGISLFPALFSSRILAQAMPSPTPMKIGIIGSGRIGGSVGLRWAEAGHEIMFSSRNPDQLGGRPGWSQGQLRVSAASSGVWGHRLYRRALCRNAPGGRGSCAADAGQDRHRLWQSLCEKGWRNGCGGTREGYRCRLGRILSRREAGTGVQCPELDRSQQSGPSRR